jgi:hypothetical protein
MGLDVYLDTKEDQEIDNAREKAWEEWYSKYHDGDGNLRAEFTEEEKVAAREALPKYSFSTRPPSLQYPDHLFNRRYLRSSYNEGGFNRAVPDMIGKDHDLYWIFENLRSEDEYQTELTEASIPLFEEAKQRALQVAEEIKASDPLRVSDADCFVGPAEHMWHAPPTPEEVLEWYREEVARREELKKEHPDRTHLDHGYSNAKGHVLGFETGLDVLAITTGQRFGKASALFVYRLSQEAKDSYSQSAEITAEFCDEAIDLIRKDGSVFLHWSG